MKCTERAEGRVVASPEYRPVGYEESRKGRGAGGIGEGGNTDMWGMKSPERAEEWLVVGGDEEYGPVGCKCSEGK
jgi:hypothetical protein